MSYGVGSGAAAAMALTPRSAAASKIEKVARGKATRNQLKGQQKQQAAGDDPEDQIAELSTNAAAIAAELDAPRPVLRLRSFGSPVSIKLVLHEKNGAPLGVPMLVEARDSLNFKGLLRWVQITVWGVEKPEAQGKLTLRYVDASGSERSLTNNNEVADWFDAMWCACARRLARPRVSCDRREGSSRWACKAATRAAGARRGSPSTMRWGRGWTECP